MEKGVAMETAQFVRRRTQLKTIIARDAKLQSFLETKLQSAVPLEEDGRSKKRKEQQRVRAGVERLQMYVRAHRSLLEVTGETDLRRIGLVFTRYEHQNLSYLGYVNALHGRSNALRGGARRLEAGAAPRVTHRAHRTGTPRSIITSAVSSEPDPVPGGAEPRARGPEPTAASGPGGSHDDTGSREEGEKQHGRQSAES
ncbi:hypothetical protein EYF80_066171 [Liparis tanakae]|uniref:ODAD1 central coiled coil region domain-containing protein n=1 Tax=Liparis tanakae TaxID=230148 RepID=A0A4Z2E4N4_9TELE|nr:hypothetical protein EYF80_066171 [Liparis tanakae]